MRILLANANATLLAGLEPLLTRAGLTVCAAASGDEAFELARLYDTDLIVLGLSLPDLSGHGVLRRMRQAGIDTPVLIVTSQACLDTTIRCFASGADDVLDLPLQHDELVARIQAIVRRSKGHAQSRLQVGRLAVDLAAKGATVDGRPVPLTGKEYRILELLALRQGVAITKEVLLDHLYGGLDEPDIRIIDVFICHLRKKLAAALGTDSPIQTVWARGYRLRDPDLAGQMEPARAAA